MEQRALFINFQKDPKKLIFKLPRQGNAPMLFLEFLSEKNKQKEEHIFKFKVDDNYFIVETKNDDKNFDFESFYQDAEFYINMNL